jgi:hypothetical protein
MPLIFYSIEKRKKKIDHTHNNIQAKRPRTSFRKKVFFFMREQTNLKKTSIYMLQSTV